MKTFFKIKNKNAISKFGTLSILFSAFFDLGPKQALARLFFLHMILGLWPTLLHYTYWVFGSYSLYYMG